MFHGAVLARRSRSPAAAIFTLIGICLLVVEFAVIVIDGWHPWAERGTVVRPIERDGLEWDDGSIVGCATVYENYPPGSWHLDVYYGASWFYGAKRFNFATRAEAVSEASKRCKP